MLGCVILRYAIIFLCFVQIGLANCVDQDQEQPDQSFHLYILVAFSVVKPVLSDLRVNAINFEDV